MKKITLLLISSIIVLLTSSCGRENAMKFPAAETAGHQPQVTGTTQQSCGEINQKRLNGNDYKDYSYQGIDVLFVQNVPDGYLSFEQITEKYGGIVNIDFFEAVISVSDLDGRGLLGTLIRDHEFLVQYKDDIFINENQIVSVLAVAQEAVDAQGRTYGLGEPIKTYNGMGEPTIATINTVSYMNEFDGVRASDDKWLCIIELEIQDNDDFFNPMWQYFSHAESIDGHCYYDVIRWNIPFIVFELPNGEKAEYCYLISPLMESIRKVKIS